MDMRKSLGAALVALGGLLAIAAVAAPRSRRPDDDAATFGRGPKPKEAERFIVHEWGTFTNFAGADGVQLDFRPLIDNELPAFVYDRAMQGTLWLGKGQRARQRMETPVIYFYTDRPREVSVSVDFPSGLLTEFYPPPRTPNRPRSRSESCSTARGHPARFDPARSRKRTTSFREMTAISIADRA